ncbi:UV-stimulated scaffold protein A isoform X1 [Trachypithecus francoisi]|uniref:UV-stimulated scaffold protein A isoform X1 n=2 Tax=Trachypithecus francoisi TaxID=54180 RepID=UPI00141AA6BB|nr:UV-stimulated scaffold protein A isoform X1 [Trachypithecus francoisi]XP_033069324.1 UV-stimulated scaffold protein A isoform X1 [Trachypithecus francoisi]XP_033069325.1 UV-stimulated scaffold protein A isoform X1 [Trachypithecus francoisi]
MDQKLSKLVEELTTSGEPRLNPEKMKELKKICKSSEEQLSRAYRLLIAQLTQEHAEIRLSAFQIVDELFARSHQFRMLVVSNFQEFLELTLGTDPAQPLPPPREAAQRLRQAATRAVEGWNEKFGEAYKKLALGYHFLRHNKKVDFQDTNARTLAERKREEEKQKHLDKIYQERASQAEREMQEMSGEIESCLTEVENCFRLLVPFDFDPNPETESLGVASGTFDALHSSCAGQVGPCWSGTPDPWDGEQPCCSRDLPASAGHPRVGSKAQPPQTATGDPSDEDEDSDLEEFVRSHGLGSHKYTLDVELYSEGLKVQENEDNLAVVHAARDTLKLIRNKFLPAVCSWIQVYQGPPGLVDLACASRRDGFLGPAGQAPELFTPVLQRFTRVGTHGGCLKRAIDLKAELELALRKYKELDIEPKGGQRHRTEALGNAEEDEDDEDFVEVPEKEGYEPHIPDHLRSEYGLEATLEKDTAVRSLRTRMRKDEEASDPTSAAAQLRRLREHLPPPSSASPPRVLPEPQEAQKLAAERARAPVVPYGVDLHYWGQELPTAGKILKSDSEHRFWKPSEVEEEVVNADVSEMLRSRHITFAGRFEPVRHRCRAPRPDGRLCERQDRLKCPFHGKIIPRDDKGRPLDPEDRAREQRRQLQKQERPEWQDPELMRDVEAATGQDLGSSRYSGKGRGKKRRYPSLTNLKAQADTARARIGRKVFAKAAVRRVVTAMNQMDQKKHEKFSNQFNYALN